MNPIRLVLLPLLVCAVCAAAAPTTPSSSAHGTAPTRGRGTATSAPARRPARVAPAPRATAAADSAVRPRSRVAPRTLDDIHIEGELPVPQVLFITARDQRRFMEFQHHRYHRSSLELGRATTTPSRIVVPAPGSVVRKENER